LHQPLLDLGPELCRHVFFFQSLPQQGLETLVCGHGLLTRGTSGKMAGHFLRL
jgi:hypothetical protein